MCKRKKEDKQKLGCLYYFARAYLFLFFLLTFTAVESRVLKLASFWVEIKCPEHGLERFRIKIVRKFNMKPELIIPQFRRHPTAGDLSCLLVGRNVSYKKVENYLADYFHRKGLVGKILRMQLV